MLHTAALPIFVLSLMSQSPVGICDVAEPRITRREVVLRAVGQWMREAFVLVDHTCPAAKSSAATLPALIMLEDPTSSSGEVMKKLKSLQRTPPAPFFQIVVSGFLSCVKPFAADANELGEIIVGNGFGPDGLFVCRLQKAKVRQVHRLDE